MLIEGKKLTVVGKLIKTAKIAGEWNEVVEQPETLIDALKTAKIKADIFSFWQLPPDIKPKYSYYMEWDPVAVIPIESFDHWWNKQIKKKIRQAVKKAQRKGVNIKVVQFDDQLVKGIHTIYNEASVRQGKPFRHYGKDFDTIKKDHATYLEKSEFIGAYYNQQLIGFIKLTYMEGFADTMQIIGTVGHRDKVPINALLAKAVEMCADKGVPYLCYGGWSRGGLGDFKRKNGFEKIELPRYYVPLSLKGRILVSLRLHHGFESILPEKLILRLIDLRRKYYEQR